jgi:hypothetical protein
MLGRDLPTLGIPHAGWLKIKDAAIYNLLTMQDSSRVPEGDHKEV